MVALSTLQILTLKNLVGVGPKAIIKVGNYILKSKIEIKSNNDLVSILESLKVKINNPNGKGKVIITMEDLAEAENTAMHTIKNHELNGIGITSYYEDNFPEILRNTVNAEGKLDPPLILFYKGDLSITNFPTLAIIGTREVTEFGKVAGLYLSRSFAERDFCIVSGLALGCDTVGHLGALSVRGKTIAFLAHGLDTIYPSENSRLAQDILDNGGLLMSEYPIGIGVSPYNLVARDRLQAGISLATLVIQTGERGGTMHAANATLAAKKPLFVVKFKNQKQNEHEKSLGNALLVKKGANYISGADNIDTIKDFILNYKKTKTSLFD